jgi:hypothetical protein
LPATGFQESFFDVLQEGAVANLNPAKGRTLSAIDAKMSTLAQRRRVPPAGVYTPSDFLDFFGTNAKNRRGLSTRIPCSVSSSTPAARNFGPNTVTVFP